MFAAFLVAFTVTLGAGLGEDPDLLGSETSLVGVLVKKSYHFLI